jgi:hypothetical protein
VEEKAAGNKALIIAEALHQQRRTPKTTFIFSAVVSSLRPWLLFFRERYASFLTSVQSFSFAVQFCPPS